MYCRDKKGQRGVVYPKKYAASGERMVPLVRKELRGIVSHKPHRAIHTVHFSNWSGVFQLNEVHAATFLGIISEYQNCKICK